MNASIATITLHGDDVITVCDHCMRACCWQGEFMCDGARSAGTVDRTVSELRAGSYGESEDYWKRHMAEKRS
jgi:hypothetical protein